MTTNPSTAWHPDEITLAGYAAATTGPATSASVEAHVIGCAQCRAALVPHATEAIVAQGRARLRDALVRRRRPFLVRLAERCGLPEAQATLLTESRAMSDAWLVSLVLVLGFAAVASSFSGRMGDAAFLLVAPVVPVAGVAMVYSNTEPSLELIARSTPYSMARLLMLRTSAVLVTSLPLCLLTAAIRMDGPGRLAVWLLPALAGTVLVLALSTWLTIEVAASGVALAWAFAIGSVALHQNPMALVARPLQLAYLVVAAGAAFVIVVQSRRGHIPGGIA